MKRKIEANLSPYTAEATARPAFSRHLKIHLNTASLSLLRRLHRKEINCRECMRRWALLLNLALDPLSVENVEPSPALLEAQLYIRGFEAM